MATLKILHDRLVTIPSLIEWPVDLITIVAQYARSPSIMIVGIILLTFPILHFLCEVIYHHH
jgi:hypothetical protein